MAGNVKTFAEWEIHLTMKIAFMSLKDSNEKQLMHSNGDNIENMIANNINEVVTELFVSLFHRYER